MHHGLLRKSWTNGRICPWCSPRHTQRHAPKLISSARGQICEHREARRASCTECYPHTFQRSMPHASVCTNQSGAYSAFERLDSADECVPPCTPHSAGGSEERDAAQIRSIKVRVWSPRTQCDRGARCLRVGRVSSPAHPTYVSPSLRLDHPAPYSPLAPLHPLVSFVSPRPEISFAVVTPSSDLTLTSLTAETPTQPHQHSAPNLNHTNNHVRSPLRPLLPGRCPLHARTTVLDVLCALRP